MGKLPSFVAVCRYVIFSGFFSGFMGDLNRYYQRLDLEPGASKEAVNQAYKDLAFIWHPDRIPEDNPRLKDKAHEKLKELNEARQFFRDYFKDQLRQSGAD